MNCLLAAEAAILVHFKSVGVIFFVLRGIVVTLLAFTACEGYFDSHLLALSFPRGAYFP